MPFLERAVQDFAHGESTLIAASTLADSGGWSISMRWKPPESPTRANVPALIEYLDSLGFTAEEMVEAERRGRLFGLAGDALQRSGRPTYSLRTAAEALGVPLDERRARLGRARPDGRRPGRASH